MPASTKPRTASTPSVHA